MSDFLPRPVVLVELFYTLIFALFTIDVVSAPFYPAQGASMPLALTEFGLLVIFLVLFWACQLRIRVNAKLNGTQALLGWSVNLLLMFVLLAGLSAQPNVRLSRILALSGLLVLALVGQLLFTWRKAARSPLFVGLAPAGVVLLFAPMVSIPVQVGMLVVAVLCLGGSLWRTAQAHPQPATPYLFRYSMWLLFVLTLSLARTTAVSQLGLVNFAIIGVNVMLFALAVLVYNGIEAAQVTTNLALQLWHLPIIGGVLLTNQSLQMWLRAQIGNALNAWLVWCGLALCLLGLFALLTQYRKKAVDTGHKRWFYLVFSLLILAFFSAVTVTIPVLYLGGTAAYLLAMTLYLWQFMLNGHH